jgi:cbb3-type cytochrome oxidase cytochrome c subunit
MSRLEAHGMEVYRNEGCWYCHTQYVRESAVDQALGEPLGPREYAAVSPAMLGAERVGPDLTHVGARFGQDDLLAYLRDPGGTEPRTSMPSYAYLGESDLRALVAYLLSLK